MLNDQTQWEFPEGSAMESNAFQPSRRKRTHGRLGTLRHAVVAQRGLENENEREELALLPDAESTHGSSRRKMYESGRHRSAPPEQIMPGQIIDTCAPQHPVGRVLRADAIHGAPQLEDDDELRERIADDRRAAEESNDVPLPFGWEMQKTPQGREFYVNQAAKITQWAAPRLPPHWEERLSSDGRIYYLSLFDGNTQWEWPHEDPLVPRHQLELPGSTVTQTLPAPLALRDSESEGGYEVAFWRHPVDEAVDQIDAGVLLSMDVEGASRSSSVANTPRQAEKIHGVIALEDEPDCKAARIAKQPKWGEDATAKAWDNLRLKLWEEQRAHNKKNALAKEYQGIREFVHSHELHDQVNNWDKQFIAAHEKLDRIDRKKYELGHREECAFEELRAVYPIIQRLQWTKWTNCEVFLHCMMRSMPTVWLFANIARPTKLQRCIVHLLFVSVALLACTIMMTMEAGSDVNEDVTAIDVPVWKLFGDVFAQSFNVNILWVAIVADILARISKDACQRVFFSYSLSANRRPPWKMSDDAPDEEDNEIEKFMQLMLWHTMADFGRWVCSLGICVCTLASLTVCAQFAQPRAVNVVRAFVLVIFWAYFLYPVTRGVVQTLILDIARKTAVLDGVLTVFPHIMDFEHVGVKTPAFFAWRIEKMIEEMELMRKIHREPPDVGAFDESSSEDED
jgi:hypothetical protein